MSFFTFPAGPAELDSAVVKKYPREYALAFLLEKAGFPVDSLFATRGSELEKTMKDEGLAWLAM